MKEMRDVPAGYKQTEIGVIPEDWSIHKLGELIEIGRHIRYGVVQPGKFDPDGCLMLRSQDYSKGWQSIDSMHRINPLLEKQFDGARLKANDLVITLVGAGIAQVVEVPEYLDGTILSRSTGRIAIDQKITNSRFVSYFLKSENGRSQIFFNIKEGAQPVISSLDVSNCLIPLPPKQEQTAIAHALSDVDALINGLEKLITKKQAIKTATMQQLLTGRTRLPQFALREDGSKKGYKQSELGEIPEDWRVVTLSEIAKINMGQSPNSSNYNNRGIGLPLVQGNADISNRKTKIRNYTSEITKTANKGDLILSVRAPVGEVAITDFECCIGRGVCAINYPNQYLYHWLIYFESEWEKFSKGSTFDSINSDELKAIQLIIPSDSEQILISNIFSDMDTELRVLEQRLNKTRQIKQGMMQELLTGKTRLVKPEGDNHGSA